MLARVCSPSPPAREREKKRGRERESEIEKERVFILKGTSWVYPALPGSLY